MSTDGKLQHTAYMITIHVDPNDLQRPLIVTHHPELLATECHRVGTILQGHCLSFDKLLARTITVRAEQILEELRQELMVISPGPVRLADAPLCVYVPLLWPCHAQEYLHLRVDPVHGTICVSCPVLTSSDSDEVLLAGNSSQSSTTAKGTPSLSDGGVCARPSILAALHSIETAINRPSTRRVISLPAATASLATAGEEQPSTASNASLLSAQTRSLRNLSAGETRWRISLIKALTHLRVCLGLVRLAQTANQYKPFWHPVKRRLPLILTPSQAQLARTSGPIANSLPGLLVRIQQSPQWPIVFVQPIPNNEYYVVCEVLPSDGLGSSSLSVTYRYSLIVCTVLPSNSVGIVIDANGWLVSHSEAPSNLSPTSPLRSYAGNTCLYLQATHYVPLDGSAVWLHNPTASVSVLQSCMQKLQVNLVDRRRARLAQLLTRRQRASLSGQLQEGQYLLDYRQAMVPTLTRLVGGLGEKLMATFLALELSRVGIVHTGVQFDAAGSLSTVRLISLPNKPLSWQSASTPPLSTYVHQIVLRPHFDPFTNRRNWQLDLAFTGLPNSSTWSTDSSKVLRHQTAEWSGHRLEDLALVVKNLLAEWDSLCCMHALCYPVVSCPELHLSHGVHLSSYNLKILSLQYGSSYIANISYSADDGFALALGFRPILSSTGQTSVNTIMGVEKLDAIDFDCNPQVIIRTHLEDALNVTNSVSTFCKMLMHTLDFTRAVEPLRDSTISINGLRSSVCNTALRPLRNLVLISLSTYDLLAIYRSSLAVHISLVASDTDITGNDEKNSHYRTDEACCSLTSDVSHTTAQPYRVRLADGQGQFCSRDGENSLTAFHENLLPGLTVLPAFQAVFLDALGKSCQTDGESISTSGLTISQLGQLTQSTLATPTDRWSCGRVAGGTARQVQSPLMSYLTASLLFHAALEAVQNLEVPVYPLAPSSSGSGSSETRSTSVREEVVQSGGFLSHWSTSNLTAKVSLLAQQTGAGLSSLTWRLSLGLSTFGLPAPPAVADRWSPETIALLEEFFRVRVCAAPFQTSAVVAFFRLLTLPPRALHSVLCVLPLDLHPTTHLASGWADLRIGLVGMSGPSLRQRAPDAQSTFRGSPVAGDLAPGQPGVVVRPPCITLQLLVQAKPLQQQQHQYSKFSPLAQVVPVCYDWETNRVALAPTGCPANALTGQPGHQLIQLLRDADVETRANRLEPGNTGGYATLGASGMTAHCAASALWHLAILVSQIASPVTAPGDSAMGQQKPQSQQTCLPGQPGHMVISHQAIVMPSGSNAPGSTSGYPS